MNRLFLLSIFLWILPATALAQIYRWTDASGQTHFSNQPPPPGVKAVVVDPDAKAGPPSPDSTECHTIRCQGERLEERERRREAEAARLDAERREAAAKQPRGLDFRKYLSIQRGMSEGELLGIAGEPDRKADHGIAISAPVPVQATRNLVIAGRAGLRLETWTYLPTHVDPFTTTIRLIGGRVDDVERVRKF